MASSSAWGTAGTYDVDVDAVEERSGDPAPIARDLVGSTAAPAAVMSEIAARARIHRRDELEPGGEVALAERARDRHPARLERFAKYFEHTAVELRELVEEQDAPVRKRNLPRPGVAAAPYEGEARA